MRRTGEHTGVSPCNAHDQRGRVDNVEHRSDVARRNSRRYPARGPALATSVKWIFAAVDIPRMRVRGGFLVVLIVVLVAGVAGMSFVSLRHRADQKDLRAATALAHRLPAPELAVVSHDCRGDGLVVCWTSAQDATPMAQTLAAQMRAAGALPEVRCLRVKVGPANALVSRDECSVIARFGSRATAAFVDPSVQGGAGKTHSQTLVSLSAG